MIKVLEAVRIHLLKSVIITEFRNTNLSENKNEKNDNSSIWIGVSEY